MAQPGSLQKQKAPVPSWHHEEVLVVKRDTLFAHDEWQGLRTVDFTKYLHLIHQQREFIPRGLAEEDPAFKQIIPYMVFQHQDKYFLMQRKSKATERRLQSRWTLGIGGHVRQEDIGSTHIFDWARREFYEEIAYEGELKVEPLGILNDDSNAVGQVHLGLVLLLRGESDVIEIKEELQQGYLASLDECAKQRDSLESWSQVVLDHLKK